MGSSTRLLPILALTLGASIAGCDDGGGTPVDEGPRAAVLAHLGEGVVLPTLTSFEARAGELLGDLSAWAAAPDDVALREAAQASWAEAMDVWQRAELMQIGPAGAMFETPGGDDFRDEVYPWPDLRLCTIDELTASDDHADPEALRAEAPSRRGLGAIEYLLYETSTENNCSPLSAINEDGTWTAIQGELTARRAAMAAALGRIVSDLASELVDRWTGDDPFLDDLRNPGGGSVYRTAQAGLNAVSDALFYIETETRNMKLGDTAGLTVGCDATTCPEARESRFANRSKEHVLGNVMGFRRVFFGAAEGGKGTAPGFDDLLVGLGAGEVATQMDEALAAATSAVEAIPGTLGQAVDDEPEAVEAAFQAVRQIDEILETEVLGVLGLSVPQSIPADND